MPPSFSAHRIMSQLLSVTTNKQTDLAKESIHANCLCLSMLCLCLAYCSIFFLDIAIVLIIWKLANIRNVCHIPKLTPAEKDSFVVCPSYHYDIGKCCFNERIIGIKLSIYKTQCSLHTVLILHRSLLWSTFKIGLYYFVTSRWNSSCCILQFRCVYDASEIFKQTWFLE